MLQEYTAVQPKLIPAVRASADDGQAMHREEILKVLTRAARDRRFIADLTRRGSEALQEYDLNWREKAALISGDINWIESRVGALDARLRTWLDYRVQQEIW